MGAQALIIPVIKVYYGGAKAAGELFTFNRALSLRDKISSPAGRARGKIIRDREYWAGNVSRRVRAGRNQSSKGISDCGSMDRCCSDQEESPAKASRGLLQPFGERIQGMMGQGCGPGNIQQQQ